MAKSRPGYSSQKPSLPGGRAMYNMPVFGAPGRNRYGQTQAQAKKAAAAAASSLLLPEERRYMMPDLGEDPTMRSERLEGERMGQERGTTVASRRREKFGRGARRAPSKAFQAWKKNYDQSKKAKSRPTFYDDQYI